MALGDLSYAFDPAKDTPQTIARKRQLAEAIMGNAVRAPRDVGEGLTSIGQAILYRSLAKSADKAEAAGQSGAAKVFNSLFGEQFPAAPALSATAPVSSAIPAPANDHPTPPVYVGAAPASIPSGGNADVIKQGLVSRGMDPKDADAFVMNFQDESGLDPTINEKNPIVPGSRGGFGIGQWTGPRRKALENYAAQQGKPVGDLDTQLDYLMTELKGPEAAAYQTIQAAPSTGSAAAAIVNNFLRPSAPLRAKRAASYLASDGQQVASNDASIGMPPASPLDDYTASGISDPAKQFRGNPNAPKSVDPMVYSDPTNMPDPLIELLKKIKGGGNSGVPASQPLSSDRPMPSGPMPTDAASSIGQPYAPAPMPQPYAGIQQQAASMQPPMDAKAAIARAMSGQGQSFPPEMGPQDVPANPPPDVINAGLWPRGGQRVLDAMMQQQPIGGPPAPMQGPASAPMQPPSVQPAISPEPAPGLVSPQAIAGGVAQQQVAQAAPPLPPPTTVQDRPIGPEQGPDLSALPAMAGGVADVIAPGAQQGPSTQQLMQAAGDPWVMQRYGPIVDALLQQKMKQGDPTYALDLAKKKLDLQIEQQQLGGSFRGDSLDAQAWNILQTRDPNSKEYATAYSIVSQPKTQLVQTANGLVPVQTPPNLPGWLKAPGAAGGPSVAPEGAPPAPSGESHASNAPAGPGSPATASSPIPGTKQPATEMQARNGAIGKILLNEVPTLGANFQALADPKGQLLNALPGGIGNAWQSPEYQRAANAVKASVSNVLYSLSGASSNPGEVLNQIGILTPAFGDSPATINDKLQRFKTYVRAISSEANDPELTKNVEDAIAKMDTPAAPQKKPTVIDGYTIEEVQ